MKTGEPSLRFVSLKVVAVMLLLSSVVLAGCFDDEDPSAISDGPPAPPTPLPTAPPTPPHVPAPEPLPWHPSDGLSDLEITTIASPDGHAVPVSIYKPQIADNETQVPIILQSHGFTGSKATAPNAFLDYVAAGFGVVSFDQRGHGAATDTSSVGFMQPDLEVLDAIAIIDEISTWDWVLMENETTRDPYLGTIGGSYGGAFQLMTSIFDDRIDAMVPEITWHNITTALAPNGAIKSGWVDLFYLAGNTISPITFSDEFHRGFAWATATNELPAGQAPGVPDLVSEFNQASPQNYDQPPVPTLLVQGMTDTLFPLNQAVDNYDALTAAGADVRLYTHLTGHVLNSESLAPGNSPVPVGLQGVPGGRPCGEQEALDIAWHQKHLLGLDVPLGPRVCIALEDGSAVVGDRFPLPSTQMTDVSLAGPYPVVQAVGGTVIPIEAVVADAETVIAGIPTLRGSITSPGVDAIVYWSFQMLRADGILEHIVDDQVRPLRISGPNTGAIDFEMDLGGIGTRLQAGDTLYLVLSSIEPVFFGNSGRVPAGLVVEDLELRLPMVTQPVFA